MTQKFTSTAIRVPTEDLANHTIVLRQLKETTEIAQRLRGDPLDSFVRVRELLNSGVIRFTNDQIQSPLGGSYVPSTRQVKTQYSLSGGGPLSADLTLNLVNDTSTPGNSMYYGTNGAGTRGWYTIASFLPAVFVASGAGHQSGLVPDPGSVAGTSKFLREDATFQTVDFVKGATWTNGNSPCTVPTNNVSVRIPRACTIKELTVLTTGGTGTATFDIWKSTFAAFPPSSSNSILPSAISITSATYNDTTLTGWTKALAQGDILMFNLSAITVFTSITIQLRMA